MDEKETFYNFSEIRESERGWLFYDAALKAWKNINENIVGTKVLDVGCGSGIMMGLIKLFNPNIEVFGMGGDEGSKIIWNQRNLNVRTGDIYALPFEDGEMDTVYSSNVIEHLKSPELALKEMERVANKRIITIVPDGNVDDKNFGTQHLHNFNRVSILGIHKGLKMKYVKCHAILDNHMNQLIAVYEK